MLLFQARNKKHEYSGAVYPIQTTPPWSMRSYFVDLTLEPLFGQPRLPARRALQAQEPSPVCPQSKHTPLFAKWINGVFDALREFETACQFSIHRNG